MAIDTENNQPVEKPEPASEFEESDKGGNSQAFGIFGGGGQKQLEQASKVLLRLALFLTPIAFLPFGNFLGLGKEVIVGTLVLLAFIFWGIKALFEGEITFRNKAPMMIVGFILLISGAGVIFAQNQYDSFLGASGNYLNFLNIVVFVLSFWLLLSRDELSQEQKGGVFGDKAFRWFLGGGSLALIFGILQLFGWHILPFQFTKNVGFNTVGTVKSLAIFSGFLLAVSLGELILKSVKSGLQKTKSNWVHWVVMGLSLFYILLASYLPVWFGLIVVAFVYFVLAVLLGSKQKSEGAKQSLAESKVMSPATLLPVFGIFLLGVVVVFSSFIGGNNVLDLSQTFNLQRRVEVGPSQAASFGIAKRVYKEGWKEKLLGSGFGSFPKKWELHRSKVVNQTRFWGVNFQRGASGFTTILVEGGFLITVAFLMFLLRVFWLAAKKKNWVKLGAVTFLILLWFFYPFNFTIWMAVFVLAASS